jgi:hypothetical protein
LWAVGGLATTSEQPTTKTGNEATGSPGNLRRRNRVFTPLPDQKIFWPG